MIQRIQSIWLLLAAACAVFTFRLPFYVGIRGAKPASVIAIDGLHLIIVTSAIVFAALIAIFLFRTRKLQIRFCLLGIVMELGLLYLYYRRTSVFLTGEYTIWSVLHLLILIFFLLAIRGIRKDDKLLKESERLR